MIEKEVATCMDEGNVLPKMDNDASKAGSYKESLLKDVEHLGIEEPILVSCGSDIAVSTVAGGNTVNGDHEIVGEGGICQDQALTVIADNQQGIKAINGVAPYNEIPVESPYGPWMMVKKPIRRKDSGRHNYNQPNTGNTDRQQTNLGNQSRFAALDIEEEKEEDSTDVDMGGTNKGSQQILSIVGNSNNYKHVTNKVRNHVGGKNPQNKSGKAVMGQPNTKKINNIGPSKERKSSQAHERIQTGKEVDSLDNSISSFSKVPLENSVEKAQSSKEKEIEILHKMRLLQQQGVNGIDGFVTQVHLSALEVAHMKSNLNNSHALHQKDPKPPDNAKNEIGTPAMEIDEPGPVYSGIDQQKNEIHSGTIDHSGPSSSLSQ
ncbi:hypothetical protein RIF29_22477 [Crotalaria pallida]|uniref:Uncharacterized protein n=1 Tax=Crotalaria pallida TaxID=3830 RepID=A0AAN9F4P0_CROPI